MDLLFIVHAEEDMAERAISEAEVREALAHPFDIAPGHVRGRMTYDANVGGRGIRVVVEDGTDPLVVVAVMFRRLTREHRS